MKNTVSLIKCKSYKTEEVFAAVKRAVDLLGGMRNFVKPGERILLKPNLLSARHPDRAVTTHPEVARAVARLVREAGAVPYIGDSPGGAIKGVEHVWKETGMYAMAKEENIELLNFETAGSVETNTNHPLVPIVNISKIVFEIDGIINLPKLKTHGLATFTGAVKNFYGCIPGFRKGEYHKLIPPYAGDFGLFLADIYLAIEKKVRLNVMDGIVGMEGNGPASGDIRELDIISACEDALSMDRAVTRILGFNPENIGTVHFLTKHRKKEGSFIEAELIGDSPASFNLSNFKFPETWYYNLIPRFIVRLLGSLVWLKPKIIPEICTACLMCVNSCPVKAIEKKGKKPEVLPEECISCLCCHELCPVKAIGLEESKALKVYHWLRSARKEIKLFIRHHMEYYSLRSFAFLVRLLPLNLARFLARRLADFVFFVIPIRKKVVIGNLTESFKNEKTAAEIRKIARKTYQQFTQTMIELLFFPKFSNDDIKRMVKVEDLSMLANVVKTGKGAVIVGAHFGNWELMGAAFAQYFPITFIVGLQSNHLADDLLNAYRTAKGIKIVSLKLALRGVIKTLKNNEFVAILSDQDAHEKGTFVNFFGRPASTPKGPAVFALRAGCPLIMASMFREKEGFRALFEEVPRPVLTGNEEDDIRNLTNEYTKILEKHTREYPDHWFWFHKRWKTKQ